ncbi:MAG TPA: choice-of-anchor Q domain-containing protein, partial [Verrucomicrobiae bacterium]
SGPYQGSSGTNGVPDLQGSFSSLSYNLIGQTNGSFGFTNGVNGDLAGSTNAPLDPILGPLADNGGPTFTMALLHGSPALDAGDDALLQPPYALKNDQRGFPRKSGAHVDIGAFEFQSRNHGPHPSARELFVSGTLVQNGNFQSNTESKDSSSAMPTAAPGYQLTLSDDTPGATFSVLAATNLSLPIDNWRLLGQPVQISPGLFQFNDLDAASNPQRFYRVSSP